jgi:acyl-CoA synthetase (NDP forming)
VTEHPLDPLLQPASIALLGASERAGSPGITLAGMVIESDYAGAVYPVNPGYTQILGLPCYADLAALPQTVDHVIIALGNAHLEGALSAVIEHGAKAATIYSSGVLQQDCEPPLKQRLAAMARAAGLHICGINGMGFYNLELQLYAGIFPRAAQINRGGIGYIAQSGSAFTTLCHNGCRLGFNLCVSAGNEMTTSVADYMDWCLEREDTRVIALFLETVRDPRAFVAALEKARERNIPVVVLKIGKSPLGASLAVTHTGAIAGNQAVFEALCQKYGVIEVDDFDEMAALLMLLQHSPELPAGGFAAVFESGGFRELVSDTAFALGLDFAPLEDATCAELERHLDPGLKPENPLDIWGSHTRFEERFVACLLALARDPNVAVTAFITNYRDGYYLSEAIYRVVEQVRLETGKLIVLATCYSDLANAAMCQRAHAAGIPLIDGTRETLLAIRHLFAWRDFLQRGDEQAPAGIADADAGARWKPQLAAHSARTLDEHQSLSLLGDFAIPVVAREIVDSQETLSAAAARIGYPLVLKTAQPGIDHKSDCGGVVVGIADEQALLRAYRDIDARLGPRVLVSKMAARGIEVALGTVNDRQFGPLVMVAAGGIMIELLDDRAISLCPVTAARAEAMLGSLKLNRLLAGARGQPAINRQALIDAIVRLSHLAFELRDSIDEIDVNPVIASAREVVAVDALVLCNTLDA